MTVHVLEEWPCSQKEQRTDPELLVIRAAAVSGSGLLKAGAVTEPHQVANLSLASTSWSMTRITFSTYHFSSMSSRLMIKRISDGNLFIRIDVSKQP